MSRIRRNNAGLRRSAIRQVPGGVYTWMLVKAEHLVGGANLHYVTTSLKGGSQHLHDEVYCARGEMENRIREH